MTVSPLDGTDVKTPDKQAYLMLGNSHRLPYEFIIHSIEVELARRNPDGRTVSGGEMASLFMVYMPHSKNSSNKCNMK